MKDIYAGSCFRAQERDGKVIEGSSRAQEDKGIPMEERRLRCSKFIFQPETRVFELEDGCC